MIEYIKGDIAEITPAMAVIDCNGVGYGINISLNTYSAIQNQTRTKLYIYEAIREDAYVLYGFSTKQESRTVFTVNLGIGYWRKYRKNDFIGPFSFRIMRGNQFGKRQTAENS